MRTINIYVPPKGKGKIQVKLEVERERPWAWLKKYSRTVQGLGNGKWQLDRIAVGGLLDSLDQFDEAKVWIDVFIKGSADLCMIQCQGARPDTAHDCECVCVGEYHGRGDYYKQVTDSGLVVVTFQPKSTVRRYEKYENGNLVYTEKLPL